VALIAYVGGWALAALIAVAGVLGLKEVYDLAAARGIDPMRRLGYLAAAAAPFGVGLGYVAPRLLHPGSPFVYADAAWMLAVLGAAVARRGPEQRPLAAVAVTILGTLYASWLLSFAMVLRHPMPGLAGGARIGTALLFFPLVVTWIGDTAAYAGGTAFGGPKLAPVVSPNKTWSGAAAGLFAGVATALIYSAVVFRRVGVSVGIVEAMTMGAAIGVAGQLGDLVESLIKREAGVKDSSTLIPGHGGVLDRLDALYFALPVTAMLYAALGIAG
jgi:phosphatidate cytidylyltransferase